MYSKIKIGLTSTYSKMHRFNIKMMDAILKMFGANMFSLAFTQHKRRVQTVNWLLKIPVSRIQEL